MPKFPHASETALSLSDQVFSRLAAKAQTIEGELYPLHVGDTYRAPIPEARAEAQHHDDHEQLHGYAPVQGIPALVDAIGERLEHSYGVRPDRGSIQVMSGATAGLSVTIHALVDPGDEVLLPAPFWPLIRGIIARRGAVPVQVPLFDRLADPTFDVEKALEAKITSRTTAIYINTPNNPTGVILPPEVIRAMLRVAQKHQLWVFSDEAYEELWFEGERPRPVWTYPEAKDRVITNHTLSKSYGLAGARIGFAHGPNDIMKVIRSSQTFTTYCQARPMQHSAVAALSHGDAWLQEARSLYGEASRLCAEHLGVSPPPGGTFLFFDAAPWLKDSDESSLPFLEKALDYGVLLTPGSACGEAYARWVRLCFTSVPIEKLREALERLRPLLSSRT